MAISVPIKVDAHVLLTPALLNAKLAELNKRPPVMSFAEFHDTMGFVDGGWTLLLQQGFPTTGDPAKLGNGWVNATSARAWFGDQGWTS